MATHRRRPLARSVNNLMSLARTGLAITTTLLMAAPGFAQPAEQTQDFQQINELQQIDETQQINETSAIAPSPDSQSTSPVPVASAKTATAATTVTVPAGSTIALVLTQPVQTRHIHHGDDIYAQITSPVTAGNDVVIPPGTFVQGKVDKIERHGGRGEVRLQSMAITFPDGYTVPVAGPMTLETPDGYALKDPGNGRSIGAFALPAAGAGIGALIGHFAANTSPNSISNPPGCTGAPPECLTASVPGSAAKDTIIGAGIGGIAGGVTAFALLFGTHNFFLDVGAPVEMLLEHPLTLEEDQVAQAVQQSEQHPVAEQPIAPRPVPYYPPAGGYSRTCYTPGTPGTPGTDIPGTPATADSPGTPAIHIPGIPPTPPTPYPCP
jgi:hypothetical protein